MDKETREVGFAMLLIFIGVAILSMIVDSCGSTAFGQAAPRRNDALMLAQITIHEAGWEDTGDMEAIYAVLRAGAAREELSFRAYAIAYSGRIYTGETNKRWVRHLTETCEEPAEWPRVTVRARVVDGVESFTSTPHAPWSTYRARCVEVMARARAVVAGERTDRCERTPHDWGGSVDLERARRIGLIEVNCAAGDVETRNTFYVRPSLIE